MASFIKALLLVVVAEMGDKTQLLAMAMASRYKAKQVLAGALIPKYCYKREQFVYCTNILKVVVNH
jgi:putative Ca2+/H+ antiporter (TMEM165/GDT1 family)